MKKLLLLAAGLGASLLAHGQTSPTWTQVWSDEFNGPVLDQTKWSYETGTGVNGDFGTGQLDRATARPENVAIEAGIAGADGGALRISTRRETYLDRNYTSGRLNTKDKAAWGPGHRIVARVWPQGVRTQGQGFAFWLLGNEAPAGVASLTWPQVGEVDIMEYVGSLAAYNLGTVHYAYQYNNNQYADWNHGSHGAYYSFAEQQLPDAPEWLQVDLGALYNVSRVILNWENNGTSYVVETSTDGTTWQPAYRTSTGKNGVSDLTFAAVSARFVRVTGTLRVNQYGYSLYELQVFADGSYVNLALNKLATSSSVERAALGPALAVDGDAKTRWASAYRNPPYQCCAPASTTDSAIGANGWHTYGLDWYTDRMEFFVDNNVYHIHYFNDGAVSGAVDGQNEEAEVLLNGKKVLKSEYSNMYPEWHPFEHKLYAILSAGVGGSNNTYGGPIAAGATFPADVYVDWVRVYANQVVTATAAPALAPSTAAFPNPVAATCQLTNVAENTPVKVLDVTGRLALQTKVSGGAVDLSALRAGVYVLVVQGPGGTQRVKVSKQ
ncbi:discoidin domain-containing protein [Hymenobacter sp. BRD128]|uniref:discoidin domain-containing protein n=1 Tax=Hymenobacter sp. BRD128 TaxID=2675878 RepID=UPI001566BDB5|nr:discoidin domain-containing protein [Hymenobacter sp. BRD128]QKG56475.1 discoidin domain-containing protein [Hymenobacter sp. BRD128]